MILGVFSVLGSGIQCSRASGTTEIAGSHVVAL